MADPQGKQHAGYLNPLLEQISSNDFTDKVPYTFDQVTLNNNAEYGKNNASMADMAGYGLSSGFGNPRADQFVHDLVAFIPLTTNVVPAGVTTCFV